MLALASIALIVIAGGFALGSALLGWAQSRISVQRGDQFFIATWIGLLWAAGCLMAIAQFIPLNRLALVGMLPFILLAMIVQRRYLADTVRAFSFDGNAGWAAGALAASAIGIAVITSRDVVHFDTGFYQLPQVIWLQEHGLVAGLGLLHHRFGYNSIWLALVAPIQDLSHDGRLAAIGGTIACTMLAFQVVYSGSRIAAGDGRPADWLAVAAPLSGAASAWLLSAIISSSPDIPVWILTLLLVWILLIDRNRQLAAAAMMVAIGATAIELSAAPLLIGAAIYAVWTRQVERRNCLAIGMFAALTLGSVVMANIITSGCLMLPAASTCLPVSWAIPKDTAKAVTQSIALWPLFGNIVAASYRLATGWVGILAGLVVTIAIVERLRPWLAARLRSSGLAASGLMASGLPRISRCNAMALGAASVLILGLAVSPIERVGDRDLRESGFANRPTRLSERWLLPPPLVAHQPNPAKGMISGTSIPRSEPTQWIETRARDMGFVRPQSGEQCWGVRLACAPPGEPFRPITLRNARRGIAFGLAPRNEYGAAGVDGIELQTR